MKIIAVNGSGRSQGNSAKVIQICKDQFGSDVEVDVVELAKMKFDGCRGCEGCAKTFQCVLKDDMSSVYPLLDEADGLVLVSPTYFYNITSKMKAFIERLYPYEVFDPDDRHVWMARTEAFGFKYALVIGICEQADVKDMGFTIEAMSLPLQALGYRVVEEVKVLHAFKKDDIIRQNLFTSTVMAGAEKLKKTIILAKQIKKY